VGVERGACDSEVSPGRNIGRDISRCNGDTSSEEDGVDFSTGASWRAIEVEGVEEVVSFSTRVTLAFRQHPGS
jgi:hypothetical protein